MVMIPLSMMLQAQLKKVQNIKVKIMKQKRNL